ncbi:MAG: ABC transporter permease [Gemmatimonadetes bacterium]|nr:ABC transporter permease [Gemmatimonadota bacterium]
MNEGVWWLIAWRNLWRNRRRTLITAGALAFGFMASVLMIGLADGMVQQMISNATEIVTGQVQIHSVEYLPERSLYETIGGREGVDVAALLDEVTRSPGVTAAAPRVYGGGLVSAGSETVGSALMGIDVVLEPEVSRLLGTLEQGSLPSANGYELLIGAEMARRLEVGVGAEVVVVAPAADGSLGNDLFTVAGIFRTGIVALDGAYAILPLGVFQELVYLDPGRIHEIAVTVDDTWAADGIALGIQDRIAQGSGQVTVRSWTEFRAELRDYIALAESFYVIIIIIIFVMVLFGVANTMLMGTFERRREFAVVRALGTGPGSVAKTVVYEGVVLGIVSLVMGLIITIPVMMWLHNAPPDLSRFYGDFTMAGALIRPVMTVEYSLYGAIATGIALLVTSILAALYPAVRAVQVPPADALADR